MVSIVGGSEWINVRLCEKEKLALFADILTSSIVRLGLQSVLNARLAHSYF